MRKVVFLTLEDRGEYVIDDALAIDELARRGVAVEEIPWRRFEPETARCDAVLVRTTWDYQNDLPAFLALLSRIERARVPLANAAGLIAWNADKRYLRELAGQGVRTVPTVYGEGLTPARLRALPRELGVERWVLKPTVGANASDATRFEAAPTEAQVSAICERFPSPRGWMAQPFVSAVLTEGEYSVFYFGGRRSHAIRKVPRAGDFRVQEEHGGHIEPHEPDALLVEASERVLASLGRFGTPLQARVDLVRLDDGALALMELEAIEPSLYFRTHPRAPANFADALERWLTR